MAGRILVPLDPSPFSSSAVDYACGLAKGMDAEVTGLMILDAPDIEKSVRGVTPGALEYAQKAGRRKEADAHRQIQQHLAEFARICEQRGIRHRELEVQGEPASMIIGESVFFDIVVMGIETHYKHQTSDAPCDTLQKIAGHMMPPVIAVPEERYEPSDITKITVAFGGSRTAARSIRQFVNLGLFQKAEITILCSNPEINVANELIAAVSRYMNAHGYDNLQPMWTPRPVVEELREKYLDETDLIVLGAHAKHGILSFLYGQVTRFVLNEATTPVFIAN